MLAIRKGLQNERGFTLVEVTIILLVLVILSTIMLPQLGNFNRLARYVVVKEDVGAICATLKKFLDEVMLPGPFAHPGGGTEDGSHSPLNKIGLLVGPGQVPNVDPIGNTFAETTGPAIKVWEAVTGLGVVAFSIQPDDAGTTVPFYKGEMINHLQVNMPWSTTDNHGRYKNVLDDPTVGAFFGWRGPYFNEINADPWGTRYSVNTFGLHGGLGGNANNVFFTAVICISFGPNKNADTNANMPGNASANGPGPDYAIGGDDIAAVLSAGGPF